MVFFKQMKTYNAWVIGSLSSLGTSEENTEESFYNFELSFHTYFTRVFRILSNLYDGVFFLS